MRARRLRYAAEALSDIASIRAYLKEHAGPLIAAKMQMRIRAAIAGAREMPSAGVPRPEYRPDCRFVVEHPYVIYYDYDGETMIVLRVLHWARDRVRIMGGDDQQ